MTAPADKTVPEQWREGHQWHATQAAQRVEVARRCLRLIRSVVSLDTVADFGCGIGGWLAAAKEMGAGQITGFEGDWIATSPVLIPRDAIKVVDLATTILDLRKQFTLAMTIEVAEHLPEAAAEGFITTLTSAADHIVFSAAIPGQGGSGHVNEQPLIYWVRKFWNRGYIPLDPIRPYIARDRFIFPWLRQNVVMFAHYDAAIRDPNLMRFARPLGDFSLEYRHNRDLGGF